MLMSNCIAPDNPPPPSSHMYLGSLKLANGYTHKKGAFFSLIQYVSVFDMIVLLIALITNVV